MKNKFVILCIIVILTTLSLCGCNEQKATETKTFEKINFETNVLELVDSSIETLEEGGEILSVTVTLYFKNALNNHVNVTYVVDFCDSNDNILYSKQFDIVNIPRNYIFYTPDVFTYNGEDAYLFDHINIKVTDYEIIG